MSTEEFHIDAEHQPLEFALLACDLLSEQSLDPNDATELSAEALTGGFQIALQIGDRLTLHLAYNEATAQYIGTVCTDQRSLTPRHLALALSLNSLMPAKRRFDLNVATGDLQLSETWPANGLALGDLAAGLYVLIQSFDALILGNEAAAPPPTASSMAGIKA
jgi:hypothetical protein